MGAHDFEVLECWAEGSIIRSVVVFHRRPVLARLFWVLSWPLRFLGLARLRTFSSRTVRIAQKPRQPRGESQPTGDAQEHAHRLARVETVWGNAAPFTEAEQWSRYPLSHPVVKMAMNRRASGDPERDGYWLLRQHLLAANAGKLPVKHAVSLCCGSGSLDRGLVQGELISRFTGYDLAAGALDAARAAAEAEGIEGAIYKLRDLERDGLDEEMVDLVIAHHAVHHISRLEQLFDSVHLALRPGGIFHLEEFVGPNRFQWTERQLEEMSAWVGSVPERYRVTRDGALKTYVGRATIAEMLAFDPSEAVRSAEIERLVTERFEILERRPLGGTLAMMALVEIGHNFDPRSAEAVDHLQRLLRREDELIASRELDSDFMVLIARRAL